MDRVGHFMPAALATLLRKAPLTDAKVAFAWRSAVGATFDRVTAVTFKDGVLHVRARDAAWQREVERAAGLVRHRLDAILGAGVVKSIDVVS
jgi:hypothetical protein